MGIIILFPGITLHPGYLSETPEDYVNQSDFIKKFEAKLAERVKKRTSNKMETDNMDAKKAEVNSIKLSIIFMFSVYSRLS